MIVVIADDLSGATELASAAVEAGLTAEVQTERFESQTQAELVAVSTESRQRIAKLDQVDRIAGQISKARPDWIFKKTDSILRGHVAAEITKILERLELKNALLIPANPKKARTISDGAYFVDGTPLHLTAFSNDPDFPRKSCDVVELTRGGERDDEARFPVFWIGNSSLPKEEGIFIPEMQATDSMIERSQQVESSITLPAGGVEFFEALLPKSVEEQNRPAKSTTPSSPTLFVCGSAAAWELGREEEFAANKVPIATMPPSFFNAPAERFASWLEETNGLLKKSETVAIAIGNYSGDREPTDLLEPLTRLSGVLIEQGAVARIFAEGGATAAAIIKNLGWSRFHVESPISPGIAELIPFESPNCSIAIKPGSYPWDFAKILS